MRLSDLPVRVVRLLRLDEEDAQERKRRLRAEASRRWRERNPEKVKKGNARAYAAHRMQRLAAVRAERYGPNRAAFLAARREANARYYARVRARRVAEGWRPGKKGFTTFSGSLVAAQRRKNERGATVCRGLRH